LSLGSIQESFAQDPIFSQLFATGPYYNPAHTFNALTEDNKAKFDLLFRDQWNNVGVGDNYATSRVSIDYNFYNSGYDSWNAGLYFLSDRSNVGYLKQTNFQVFSSYTRQLSGSSRGYGGNSMLTFGTSVGFGQTNVDLSNLWFGRQYDLATLSVDRSAVNGEPGNINNSSYTDISVGAKYITYQNDDNYITASIGYNHLNRPSLDEMNSSLELDPRFTFQFEAQLPLGESLFQRPGINLIKQDWAFQIVPHYLLSFDLTHPDENFTLITGFSSRIVNGIDVTILDAVTIHLGIASSKWHLNFSFDVNTSTLRPATNGIGALELGLGYNIKSD